MIKYEFNIHIFDFKNGETFHFSLFSVDTSCLLFWKILCSKRPATWPKFFEKKLYVRTRPPNWSTRDLNLYKKSWKGQSFFPQLFMIPIRSSTFIVIGMHIWSNWIDISIFRKIEKKFDFLHVFCFQKNITDYSVSRFTW